VPSSSPTQSCASGSSISLAIGQIAQPANQATPRRAPASRRREAPNSPAENRDYGMAEECRACSSVQSARRSYLFASRSMSSLASRSCIWFPRARISRARSRQLCCWLSLVCIANTYTQAVGDSVIAVTDARCRERRLGGRDYFDDVDGCYTWAISWKRPDWLWRDGPGLVRRTSSSASCAFWRDSGHGRLCTKRRFHRGRHNGAIRLGATRVDRAAAARDASLIR
jgi:hypothetical protein